MGKNSTNTAIRGSLERVALARMNRATKMVRVEDIDAAAIVDFPQSAPHEVARVITEAIPARVKSIRYFYAHSNLSAIRTDVKVVLANVQSMEYTDDELLGQIRSLRDKHGERWISVPSPDDTESYWKKLKHIQFSLSEETEWNRAIKRRYNQADNDLRSVKELERFEAVVVRLGGLNGAPVEFSEI